LGDRERDEDDGLVDLEDVGVRPGHELARLGLVVERECMPLEVAKSRWRRSVSER